MSRRSLVAALLLLGAAAWGWASPTGAAPPARPTPGADHTPAPAPRLVALSYHDVVESPAAAMADATAVTVDDLVRQLAWLQAAGYQPIRLADWEAAATGGPLPDKPVLLTFDDGYASFHRHVLPLLELFDFPAVVAPVTGWVDAPAGSTVRYGDESVPRERFMTWEQLREAAATGLVEVASHSHDLHHGVPGNPFGNTQPAATTRRYDAASGAYEDDAAYRARLREDLARSAALIEGELGTAPRTVVWPYGAYNAVGTAVAGELGMSRSLTLDDSANLPGQRHVHRLLIGSDTTLGGFVTAVRGGYLPQPLRAAHVDLDYLYDPDPAQQAQNLDRLLDRIKAMGINRVFLQAFADPDGDGAADALYFPNRHLPVRADLFNRVAWQLKTRANVRVLAWLPVLAYVLPDPEQNARLAVQGGDPGEPRYHRLSPFHPEARRIIREIYADLGSSSQFAGVLFHDDAFLAADEDAHPQAVLHHRAHGSLAGAGEDELARAKTRHLIDFTGALADTLRAYHPALETARNLYARVVTEPDSERRFAQNLALFLEAYDYTAVMAMPWLEGAAGPPERWLTELVARVDRHPGALERTVFEIQTTDWQSGRHLSDDAVARQLDALLDAGARHIAWYPDDFVGGRPALALLRGRLSVADHPALLP